MVSIITVENINKSYRDVKAVQNLSFSVEPGSCYGFLGPNGAGKTTAMKIIYGKCTRDKTPESIVNVFGYDPAHDELSIKFLSGVVQQEDNLDDELDVVQNLMIYSKFYNIHASEAKKRIKYLLDFFELSDKSRSKIRELSGGMKRRLVIARALLNQPKLLILDEPTTGLDPQVRHLIWEKIRQLQKQNTTVLLTTHYMDEAFQLCNHILIMHKGRKIMEGRPTELLDKNIEKFVLEILNVELISKENREKAQKNIRIEDSPGVMRYYSNDISVLKDFADSCMESGNYVIRQTNLEDVFLRATGRQLHD
ncbi:MAG: ABC transporter ATP-binding protein [Sedimentisphaerales bacterium]|nr:ABC transporter ATP-binding protein [Sedimentisphaerales bacterium]